MKPSPSPESGAPDGDPAEPGVSQTEKTADTHPFLRLKPQQDVNWFSRRNTEGVGPGAQNPHVDSSDGEPPAFRIYDAARSKLDLHLASNVHWLASLPPEAQHRVALWKGECERHLAEMESALRNCASVIDRLQHDCADLAKQHDRDHRALEAAGEYVRKSHDDAHKTKEEIASLNATIEILRSKLEGTEPPSAGDPTSPQPEELQRKVVAALEVTVRELTHDLKEERLARQETDCELARIKSERGAPQPAPVGWFDKFRRKRL